MASAVGLWSDYRGADVLALARLSRDGNQVRRRLALAVIYEGMTLHLAEISAAVAPGPMPYGCSIRRAGLSRLGSSFPPTSPCYRCPRNVQNSIRSRMSGSSCAATGCQTEALNPTTTSSTIAASPGTASPTGPGASCPADCEKGLMGEYHWELVLRLLFLQSEKLRAISTLYP
jgi:hypothetical protein